MFDFWWSPQQVENTAEIAAYLAIGGSGVHFMSLDSCIEAMKQTGLEMSHKYKETSLGGLAVSITEC